MRRRIRKGKDGQRLFMTTKQILFFITLARYGSFTKAADELYMTQPGLSYAIKQLEAELDVPLFNRNDKGVSLTRFGEIFLPYAERILSQIEAASGAIAEQKAPLAGKVNIIYIVTFTIDIIPNMLREFYSDERHSQIDIRLTAVQTTSEVVEQLKNGKADICLSYNKPENTESIRISEQELVLAVPKDHALAQREAVSLREIEGEPMVFCLSGSQLYKQTLRMFEHDRISPNIKLCTHDCSAMIAYASLGIGLSIVPHATVFQNDSVHICHIDNPYRLRDIYISRLQNHNISHAAQYFFKFCRERYSSRP